MNFARNGLASLLPVRRGQTPEHPFYELMENAEETWRGVLQRQSKTLQGAVKEYKRRYGIDPPAGFDLWFKWAQENKVVLVDEFDLMMRDVLAHHALEPKTFINRTQNIHGQPFTYTLNITNNVVDVSGPRAKDPRPKKLADMINGFRHVFPPEFHVQISGSDHDSSSVVLGKDQRKRAMELARKREREEGRETALTVDFTPDELKHFENPRRTPAWGWFVSIAVRPKLTARKHAPWTRPRTSVPMPNTMLEPKGLFTTM